jgi:hypothetical protein
MISHLFTLTLVVGLILYVKSYVHRQRATAARHDDHARPPETFDGLQPGPEQRVVRVVRQPDPTGADAWMNEAQRRGYDVRWDDADGKVILAGWVITVPASQAGP